MTNVHTPLLGFVLIVGILGQNGCSKQDASTTSPRSDIIPDAGVDVASMTAKQRALGAKDALLGRLSSALVAAMSSGGPAAAIEFCSKQAPRIAAEVEEEHRVAIGRTSFKLRNPANGPPDWAKPLVERRETEPQFVDLPDGSTGALLPIRLKPQCLVCHGRKDQIEEDVQGRLAELYPEDAATGFEDGDLRGWFWVEVPAG